MSSLAPAHLQGDVRETSQQPRLPSNDGGNVYLRSSLEVIGDFNPKWTSVLPRKPARQDGDPETRYSE